MRGVRREEGYGGGVEGERDIVLGGSGKILLESSYGLGWVIQCV